MSVYIDADAFVRWEKGEFDLPAWLEARGSEPVKFPATVWQQLSYGVFGWQEDRARKRGRFLAIVGAAATVASFSKSHAECAAPLAGELKLSPIGFADFQIAATALVDGTEFLTFNRDHFDRVRGLKLAAI